MELNELKVIVTGGASGLGAATVRALTAAGASVTILDLSEDQGHALADELGDGTLFAVVPIQSHPLSQ